MKKIILAICLSAMPFVASAREYAKNIVSVEAGYNTAWMTSYGVRSSVVPSFMAGVTDQILLSDQIPFYFETGLLFQGKGYAIKGYEESMTRTYHLQIPVNVNYHISLTDLVSLEPGLGLYYSVGVGGKLSYAGDQIRIFKDGHMSRHDFGWTCGVNCGVSRYYVGLAYEMGFLEVDKTDPVYGAESGKLGYRNLRNYVFSVRVGVNF